MSEIEVELRRHVGIQRVEVEGHVFDEKVEHDQWYVLVKLPASTGPLHVGYLPHRDGAPLLWLPPVEDKLPQVVRERIEAAVKEKRDETEIPELNKGI